MPTFQIGPPEAPRERSPWLIASVLLSLLLVLVAAGAVMALRQFNWRFPPTPTSTATPRPPATPTPDIRATMFAEDRATQMAYAATVTRQTPVSVNLPFVPVGPTDTPTPHSVNLPYITNPIPTPTLQAESPLPQPESPLPAGPDADAGAPPSLDQPSGGVNPESPLVPSEDGGVVIETETPTPTIVVLPTETATATPTPSPTPTFLLANVMRARILPTLSGAPVWVRAAPDNTVTPVSTVVAGSEVQLYARDSSGEWVLICCFNNEPPRWIRQAYAPPVGNTPEEMGIAIPTETTPDDVRWLRIDPWPANIPQPPTSTPIPPDDFPLARRDRANSAQVPGAIGGALNLLWGVPAQASQRLTSPAVVMRQFVVVASADKHLYAFDRIGSNQLWKYPLNDLVTLPPAAQDNYFYVADNSGFAYAISDNGVPLWHSMPLAIAGVAGSARPVTGFVVAGNYLYIGVTYNGSQYVIQMDRFNGASLRAFNAGTTPIQPLAIGHQLLYVAGSQLWALDIANFELVWSRNDLPHLNTAPVYASNGAAALAELYIAGEGGRVWMLDANRGTDIRSYEGGNEPANGLALGESVLYSYGNGFVRAYDRRGFGLFWRAPIGGDVRSLIVTAEQLVLLTSNGSPQLLSPAGDNLTVGPAIPSSGANGMAVSGPYLYVPGDDEYLYGFVRQ